MTGNISSLQSFATLDGPGIRYAVFLQGCPLRCACCHNPETWELCKKKEYTAEELVKRVERYKEYFGKTGGITVSGGEPLLQTEFVTEVFELCKNRGINTCLDTSGCIINNNTERLLKLTDFCLLDIKYATDEMYRKYVGCSIEKPLEFLKLLEKCGTDTTIRRVIIEGINDTASDMAQLRELAQKYKCVKNTELLPFRKLCAEKYTSAGIPFLFADLPETTEEKIEQLTQLL